MGAAGAGATASLGMTEGGWLGELVWVLRWLHTLCWELFWLSFLSNWCWKDREERHGRQSVCRRYGVECALEVEGKGGREKRERG